MSINRPNQVSSNPTCGAISPQYRQQLEIQRVLSSAPQHSQSYQLNNVQNCANPGGSHQNVHFEQHFDQNHTASVSQLNNNNGTSSTHSQYGVGNTVGTRGEQLQQPNIMLPLGGINCGVKTHSITHQSNMIRKGTQQAQLLPKISQQWSSHKSTTQNTNQVHFGQNGGVNQRQNHNNYNIQNNHHNYHCNPLTRLQPNHRPMAQRTSDYYNAPNYNLMSQGVTNIMIQQQQIQSQTQFLLQQRQQQPRPQQQHIFSHNQLSPRGHFTNTHQVSQTTLPTQSPDFQPGLETNQERNSELQQDVGLQTRETQHTSTQNFPQNTPQDQTPQPIYNENELYDDIDEDALYDDPNTTSQALVEAFASFYFPPDEVSSNQNLNPHTKTRIGLTTTQIVVTNQEKNAQFVEGESGCDNNKLNEDDKNGNDNDVQTENTTPPLTDKDVLNRYMNVLMLAFSNNDRQKAWERK